MMAMQEETRIDWTVTYLDVMQAPEGEYRLAGTQSVSYAREVYCAFK